MIPRTYIAKLSKTLLVALFLGPLGYPINCFAKPEWQSFTPKKLLAASQALEPLFGISIKKTQLKGLYHNFTSMLNELNLNPSPELLLDILDQSYGLTSETPEDNDAELLLLAKCTLAESQILFDSILYLTGKVDSALSYWQEELEKHNTSPWTSIVNIFKKQFKKSTDKSSYKQIQDKIEELTKIQTINVNYIGQLASFITTIKRVDNRNTLYALICKHAQDARDFLQTQTSTTRSTITHKELNRTLANNVRQIAPYKNSMDTNHQEIAEPSTLEKNWPWYVAGAVGLITAAGMSYRHRARIGRYAHETAQAIKNSYRSWLFHPIARIKELLMSGRRKLLFSKKAILRREELLHENFHGFVVDQLEKEHPKSWFETLKSGSLSSRAGSEIPHVGTLKNLIAGNVQDGRNSRVNFKDQAALDTIKNSVISHLSDRAANEDISFSTNDKALLVPYIEKCFDWHHRVAIKDMTLIKEIGTKLAQNSKTNLVTGNLLREKMITVDELILMLQKFLNDASETFNDIELSMKLITILPASIIIYLVYKNAHDQLTSKTAIYEAMRHIMSEIERLLIKNKSDYIKPSISAEDQGYLIFWINKLREYKSEVPKRFKKDFMSDLTDLESENYNVDQKILTLKFMYDKYMFLKD